MRKWLKIILSAVLLIAVAAAVFLVPTIWFKPWSINHFYARVFLSFALESPMLLSSIRILEPMGLDFHNDDLDDQSLAFQEKQIQRARDSLEMLHTYSTSSMSKEEKLSYDVMDWFLTNALDGTKYRYHNYPLNQLFGVHTRIPNFMTTTHQINRRKDAENYIARVSKTGVFYEQVMEGLKLREEKGILPPRFVIQKVQKNIEEFVGSPPTENVLYTHFAEKVKELEDVDDAQREEMLARLAAEIENTVYPAYHRLIDYCQHLEPLTTTDDGVWKLPDGEAYYNYQLRSFTTTGLTAEEIHQIGLQEVGRIQAEMRAILRAEGLPTANLAATINRLNKNPRFLYPDTDAAREQILKDYQAIIEEISAGLDEVFDLQPKAAVEVKPVPDFRAATTAGAYYQRPPLDGSRPGTFFVNLRSVEEIPKFGMRTLAYHEAVPGHHFQIGIAQELEDIPFFRSFISSTAFVEGWALYAEQVAAENGFQDDPYNRLGYLQAQVFRAVRLVVDTGIHSRRWTRERAIDYMLKNTGMPRTEVVAEIERYIVIPGQATAYMVGRLKFLEVRAKAKAELGEKFDIREFHNVVLTNAALPLTLLERLVDDWIASQKAATG